MTQQYASTQIPDWLRKNTTDGQMKKEEETECNQWEGKELTQNKKH